VLGVATSPLKGDCKPARAEDILFWGFSRRLKGSPERPLAKTRCPEECPSWEKIVLDLPTVLSNITQDIE
jgi:hypothetical protein